MTSRERPLLVVLDRLEALYGKPRRSAPSGAYEMLVYANCGYPASESACAKGFAALKKDVGIRPVQLLAAPSTTLTRAMREGGIVPERRAARLKEIASVVQDEFGGDLRVVMRLPVPQAKRVLKRFPTIGDPGAEKILLFARAAALAAVPSNALQVPLRLGYGREGKSYAASYRSAQEALDAALPATIAARQRAYLLLKRHGEETCKRSRPHCEICPVTAYCAYWRRRKDAGERRSHDA